MTSINNTVYVQPGAIIGGKLINPESTHMYFDTTIEDMDTFTDPILTTPEKEALVALQVEPKPYTNMTPNQAFIWFFAEFSATFFEVAEDYTTAKEESLAKLEERYTRPIYSHRDKLVIKNKNNGWGKSFDNLKVDWDKQNTLTGSLGTANAQPSGPSIRGSVVPMGEKAKQAKVRRK